MTEYTQEAQRDIESILDALKHMATELLSLHGEMIPIAATMAPDKAITHVGYQSDTGFPKSTKVIEDLTEYLKAQADLGAIHAAGLAYIASLNNSDSTKSHDDAIIFDLESRDDHARVAIPFTLNESQPPTLADILRLQYEPAFFVTE